MFQIGFNRCATKSIAVFFHRNGYRAAHWQKGDLAAGMELARRQGDPLLTHVDGYDVYTDMERVAQRRTVPSSVERALRRLRGPEEGGRPIYAFKYYPLLDRQYPGSKFILNVRDVDAWIESRLRFEADDGRPYRYCVHGERAHGGEEELTSCWRREWRRHTREVREYFADRPDDLLVFDIEEDDPDRLVDFFEGTRWELDPDRWPWLNRSRARGSGGLAAAGEPYSSRGGLGRATTRLRAAVKRTRRALDL